MDQTILFVDDEQDLCETTKKVLTKRGYNVITKQSGEDALESLESEHPDMIILDHMLPGKTGSEICDEIKRADNTKDIPVLMATGQVFLKEPCGGNPRHIRPDDFLIKPFEVEDLLHKVETLIQNKSN